MITSKHCEKKAHKAISRLIRDGQSTIYTDSCFSLSFILRHEKEFKRNNQKIEVIKSVQKELKRKTRQTWARKKWECMEKRDTIFHLRSASKPERDMLYKKHEKVYADEAFRRIFKVREAESQVLLTADFELAETLVNSNKAPTIIFEYQEGRTRHIALWEDYRTLHRRQQK